MAEPAQSSTSTGPSPTVDKSSEAESSVPGGGSANAPPKKGTKSRPSRRHRETTQQERTREAIRKLAQRVSDASDKSPVVASINFVSGTDQGREPSPVQVKGNINSKTVTGSSTKNPNAEKDKELKQKSWQQNVEELTHMFQEIDTNGDKKIDFEEFCSAMKAVGLTQYLSERKLRVAFHHVDKDHSGEIDYFEFLEFLRWDEETKIVQTVRRALSGAAVPFMVRVDHIPVRLIYRVTNSIYKAPSESQLYQNSVEFEYKQKSNMMLVADGMEKILEDLNAPHLKLRQIRIGHWRNNRSPVWKKTGLTQSIVLTDRDTGYYEADLLLIVEPQTQPRVLHLPQKKAPSNSVEEKPKAPALAPKAP